MPDYTKCGPVQKVMKGYGRKMKSKDLRLPISLDLLIKINQELPAVCHTAYEALLFKTAFTIAFAGLLRVSELAAVDKKDMGHALLVENVTLGHTSVTLKLASSKTDQAGIGASIHLKESGCEDVCPVSLMRAFLRVRPKVKGVLFCHQNSSANTIHPLTKYQFNAVLKKALSALNMGSLPYSSHSFRIGAASHLALQFDDATILRLGRWSPKGNTHLLYVRDIEMPPLHRPT